MSYVCGNCICEAWLGENTSNCYTDCETCFLAGTPVTMADGSKKPIEKIRKNDMILAYDQESSQFKPDKVTKLLRHKSKGYLIVNGHLKVTPNHRVFSSGRWIEIGSLKIGDTLFNDKGHAETINSIEHMPGKARTYNLEVNPFHTYIAGGYVVHNQKNCMPDF